MDASGAATTRLADFVLGIRHETSPREVIEHTKLLVLDLLAVACGGKALVESSEPALEAVQELAGSNGGSATTIGVPRRLPSHYATFLSATFGHSMEFDDTLWFSYRQPGCSAFATMLAMAEARGLPGKALIAAATAGYEAFGRIGRAHAYAARGWIRSDGHHRGLRSDGGGAPTRSHQLMLLNGWGINLSQAEGTPQYLEHGVWTKRVYTGLAAHTGVVAAMPARHTVVGAADPLEGRFGYFRCCSKTLIAFDAALGD